MMESASAWIDNCNGDLLQYDFHPPGHWTQEQLAAQQISFAGLLERGEPDANGAVPGWLGLARRLPMALRMVLAAELRAGNQLTGIGSAGWPNEGSIVVHLRDRFSTARRALPPGVTWRVLDDPHYAREEMSQKTGADEFLLIS